MSKKNYFLRRLLTFGGVVLFCWSCGQGEGSKKSDLGASLQTYQAHTVSFQLNGNFPGEGVWRFVLLSDDRKDTLSTFSSEGEKIQMNLQDIPGNEVYFLQVRGKAKGYESDDVEWVESVPLLAQQDAVLTLVTEPRETFDSLSKLRFRLQGGGQEQDFLEEWYYTVADKRSVLDDQAISQIDLSTGAQLSTGISGQQYQAELNSVNKEFISQAKPLISTLYLISRENDHRSQIEAYRSLFEQVPAEAQASKYGVDLNNRILRITQPSPPVDFEKVLAARNSQLLPFDQQAFAEYEYLLLVFWSSRTQGQNGFDVSSVAGVVPADRSGEIAVLHFSLDTKMSEWKPVTDKLGLTNSYMLRAEVRQAALDHFYLTELPRFMILKPDGTVIENNVAIESLQQTVSALQ